MFENKMMVYDKHEGNVIKSMGFFATKRGLAQKFARWPTLNFLYVFIASIGKRKTKKKDM